MPLAPEQKCLEKPRPWAGLVQTSGKTNLCLLEKLFQSVLRVEITQVIWLHSELHCDLQYEK